MSNLSSKHFRCKCAPTYDEALRAEFPYKGRDELGNEKLQYVGRGIWKKPGCDEDLAYVAMQEALYVSYRESYDELLDHPEWWLDYPYLDCQDAIAKAASRRYGLK